MREYCWKHACLREVGAECPRCAVEAAQTQRETIGVLLDRLADQAVAVELLRRRVASLESRLGAVELQP